MAEAHLAHQTSYTRTGKLNMLNRKPYRTMAQKELARGLASKGSDGAYRSSAPVSYHRAPKQQASS